MSDSGYLPDASTRLIRLMKQTFGDRFREYFDGIPNEELPEGAFPCVIVHKVTGSVESGATGTDVMRSQINIHFLLNQADDVNASGSQDVTLKRLRQMIEGRSDETRSWQPGTALHALRSNITLEELTLELDTDVQYDVTPRFELPSITEATIQIITREFVPVGARN